MPADVEEAVSGVRRALKEARETIVMMVERGDYGAAIEALAAMVDKAFSRLGEALMLSVRGLGENIDRLMADVRRLGERADKLTEDMDRLTKNVAELTEDVRELRESTASLERSVRELRESVADLKDIVARHEGAVREFRGWRAERDVADRLEAWFRRRAPEYEIIKWFKIGADVLIEGKGIFAAVEITTVPYMEAVDRVKRGVGAIKEAWGREPDVLIVWSESGVVPPEVADYAAKRGVKMVRGPRELKRLLDEASSGR